MKPTQPQAPLLELGEIWSALREEQLRAAQVMIVGDDVPSAEGLAMALRGRGLTANAVAGVRSAWSAVAARAPDLRLIAFSGAGDPRGALLATTGRAFDHPAMAIVTGSAAAAAAVAVGADDVIARASGPERLALRVQARLRQAVTVRLMERIAGELRAEAGAAVGAAVLGTLESSLDEYRTWLAARGARLMLAWGDTALQSRTLDALGALRVPVLTADNVDEIAEILMVAGVDVALVHAGLAGGVVEAVAAIRGADPLVQVAVLETSGDSEQTDEALRRGAVTALPMPELPAPAICAVARRLLDARAHLILHEKVVLELCRRAPEALARWRASRVALGPGPDMAAEVDRLTNRRQDARVPMELEVLVLAREPGATVRRGTTINLSLGGSFIACAEVLRAGTAVECKVLIGAETVYLEGVVVRQGEGSSVEGQLVSGFGVRFDRIEPATLQRLSRIVRQGATRRS
ncbi:MAG TPA: PilZ domain-containing protein [Myxococcota bacterium]|jgi:DNA-binding response OmpR family regulator|nr:PilZ domain-containing protein [Myxococcota bacterium]